MAVKVPRTVIPLRAGVQSPSANTGFRVKSGMAKETVTTFTDSSTMIVLNDRGEMAEWPKAIAC
jgi:hypothetical protein